MKSQHRHELETNALAQRMGRLIEKAQLYYSLIAGAALAIVAAMLGISYFSNASAARQSDAWNSYNQAVEGLIPNLQVLRESAQDFPDSPMQQWADITWADGQVWVAARQFVQSRSAAMDALNLASSTYQSLLQESTDERLLGRAHFGLGRVYELRNELDKARAEYLAVTGGFAELAAQRAKELEQPDIQETYAWLATAEGPRRTAPFGPGTPGQRPDFAPGELDIPATGSDDETGATPSVDELLKGLGLPNIPANPDTEDRYGTGDATSSDGDTKADDSAADDAEPQD